MISEHYQQLEKQYFNQAVALNKKIDSIAFLRLISIAALVFCVYHYYNSQAISFIILSLLFISAFLFLLNLHLKYKQKAQLTGLLKTINANEIAYLNGDLTPFKTGNEFIETDHPFSHDLDIFGENAIFPHINRTTTPLGATQLATWLRDTQGMDILKQQNAVKELALKLNWRQHYLASGQLFIDEKTELNDFNYWLNMPLYYSSKTILKAFSFILPAITVVILVMNFVSDEAIYFTLFKVLFFLNIIIVGLQKNRIKIELELLTKRSNSLKQYSVLLQTIENESFTSEKLNDLKQQVTNKNIVASTSIAKLARLLNAFDIVLNPFAAIIMNGLFQYHVHALFNLEKWKINYAHYVINWFKIIGEFEALSSIAGVTECAPAPLLLGRHLLALGMEPGKRIGEITKAVYELQLDGTVTTVEDALAAAHKFL